MSDGPKFKIADEKAFFICPCFQENPKALSELEDAITGAVVTSAIMNVELHGLCGNRAVLIMIKALSQIMAYVPEKNRTLAERQVHDMLDLEMALNPSKR